MPSSYQGKRLRSNHALSRVGQSVPLTSPNYPYTYPSPLHCHLIAQAPTNTDIRVHCSTFNVYSSPQCQMDRLTIPQNGLDNLSGGISYCGGGYSDVTLNSNHQNIPLQEHWILLYSVGRGEVLYLKYFFGFSCINSYFFSHTSYTRWCIT